MSAVVLGVVDIFLCVDSSVTKRTTV